MLNILAAILKFIDASLQTAQPAGLQSVIDLLLALLPLIVQSYETLTPDLQRIIEMATQYKEITDGQMKQLTTASQAIAAYSEATAAAAKSASIFASLIAPPPVEDPQPE